MAILDPTIEPEVPADAVPTQAPEQEVAGVLAPTATPTTAGQGVTPTATPIATPAQGTATGVSPYITPESMVSTQLSNLLSADSPYLTQARGRAAEQANQLGLLSSSMAVGASERAAIESALPIAKQDAQMVGEFGLAVQKGDIESRLQAERAEQEIESFREQGDINSLLQAEKAAFDLALEEYSQDQANYRLGEEIKGKFEVASMELDAEKQLQFTKSSSDLFMKHVDFAGTIQQTPNNIINADEKKQLIDENYIDTINQIDTEAALLGVGIEWPVDYEDLPLPPTDGGGGVTPAPTGDSGTVPIESESMRRDREDQEAADAARDAGSVAFAEYLETEGDPYKRDYISKLAPEGSFDIGNDIVGTSSTLTRSERSALMEKATVTESEGYPYTTSYTLNMTPEYTKQVEDLYDDNSLDIMQGVGRIYYDAADDKFAYTDEPVKEYDDGFWY